LNQSKETKVSIIIPIFNAEKYLEECIDSAINQTYQNIEIIAIDNGSIDHSLDILKKYSNKIKIISKINGGAASALNAGIKVASGDWIKRLDADDILYPKCVEDLMLVAVGLENKTQTILYANYDRIDPNGKIFYNYILMNYNNLDSFDFNVMLLDRQIGLPTTSLIHKSTLEQFGMFNEKLSPAEDYELWLRYCLLNNCSLQLVPKTVAKYRIHQQSVSKENSKKRLKNEEKSRKIVFDKLNPTKIQQYQIALKKYKRQKPIVLKSWLFVRDNILIRFFPDYIVKKILFSYEFKRKKIRKLFRYNQ